MDFWLIGCIFFVSLPLFEYGIILAAKKFKENAAIKTNENKSSKKSWISSGNSDQKKVKDLKTAFHSFKLKSSVGQCDRAEQILKYFGYKFSLKRSPNFGAFRGAILKYGTFQIKTPVDSFFGNYWKKLGYF